MIYVGDLVKISDIFNDINGQSIGIVVNYASAWPKDERDDTQLVTVIHADGTESEWYDYNLDVVSEAGWPGA
jgi:hypothetical protein